MGNEKSGNKKNRVMFFYENDTELFREAWTEFTAGKGDFEKWQENARQMFSEVDAIADAMRIARAKAENAKGLDFPPPEEKTDGEERPERFTDVCRSMGITADWARKHKAPRFKFGKAYYALRSRMEKWQRELAEAEK